MFLLLLFYSIVASVFTFGKQLTCYALPFFSIGVRLAPGGIIFLAYFYCFNRRNFVFKNSYIPLIAGYALTAFCMDIFRLIALQYVPASNAALIFCTGPLIAAFFSWLFLHEKFDKHKIIALIIGVVGMLPLLMADIKIGSIDNSIILIAYFGVLLSTLSKVLCGIISKILLEEQECPLSFCLGWGMLIGGILSFIFSLCFETWNPVPINNLEPALQLMAFLFFTHTLIAYPLYSYLVTKYTVTLVTFGQLSVPFIAAILGYLFYSQPIGLNFFISLLILSASFWLFYKEELYLLSKRR